MELFEVIRGGPFIHSQDIRRIAREQGVHRRRVRPAMGKALPPARKVAERAAPVLTKAWQGRREGYAGIGRRRASCIIRADG